MGKLVGISADYNATRHPFQRKSFYAAGRFWVFYSDGTNMVYRTSTDGITWAGPTTIRTCASGRYFSIWFDETFLHYAYSTGINAPLYYRRGTPESDGTITWSAVEQTAVAAVAFITYTHPFVSVDSDGHAWIGYRRVDVSTPYPFVQSSYVTMSGNTDGTWGATPGGFPYSFPPIAGKTSTISIIPLTDNKMLAVYIYNLNEPVRANLWNGTVWGGDVPTSSTVKGLLYFSAVAEGDDVHLVFTSASDRLIYAKYDYSSNSFTGEILLTGTYTLAPSVISINENNDLYVFWGGYPEANTLYYLTYTAENDTWGPAVKWKSEEKLSINSLTCFYKQYSGYTGLAYTKNPFPSPSYEVKFNYVAPPPSPGVTPEPGEPGSPGAPESTPEPVVEVNKLTVNGSRHTTPEEGSIGTVQSFNGTRISRHITWVPVIITKA